MATTFEKIEFNHPNFDNRHIVVKIEKQEEKVIKMTCNVPELGDLNRGDIQKTYNNLKSFVATLK